MSRQQRPAFDAAFWFQWIMATALGWILGSFLLPYISLVAAGVGVGVMQWAVLHHRLPHAWRWPVGTGMAWIGGSLFVLIAVPAELQILVAGLILGPLVGLAQWSVLRYQVSWAGWWPVVSTMSWVTGLTLLPGILSTGALAGALTGLALALLFRQPKPTAAP